MHELKCLSDLWQFGFPLRTHRNKWVYSHWITPCPQWFNHSMLHWGRIIMTAQCRAASFALSGKLAICKHSLNLYLTFHIKLGEVHQVEAPWSEWRSVEGGQEHRDQLSQMPTGKTNRTPIFYALYFTVFSISTYLCFPKVIEVNNKIKNIFIR